MKTLIVIRHGDYGSQNLNETGKAQITVVAKKLEDLTKGKSVLLLTSHLPRAVQSAEIIGEALRVEHSIHEVFESSGNRLEEEKMAKALAIIDEHESETEYDVVIITTHMEYSQFFPTYFGRERLNTHFPRRACYVGGGYVIGCQEKCIHNL